LLDCLSAQPTLKKVDENFSSGFVRTLCIDLTDIAKFLKVWYNDFNNICEVTCYEKAACVIFSYIALLFVGCV
jgi:hypothetical protein